MSSNTNIFKQMILGLVTPLMKFPFGGVSWTLDLHNFMKICKNAEYVNPDLWFFCILIPYMLIFFSFSNLQVTDKYKNLCLEDEVGKRYLVSNLMVKSLQFSNRGNSALHVRLGYFIEIWPEFGPPSTMATLTPN